MNKKLIFIENGGNGEKRIIIYNGIMLNPNVGITKNKELCDYIFMDFRDFNKAKNYKPKYFKKLIIIDYRDKPHEIFNIPCLKYFKRSVVNKKKIGGDGTFVKYNREIIPISYCLKNEVLKFKNIHNYERNVDISVFFPPENRPQYRYKMASFIKKNLSEYNIHVGLCGARGEKGRNNIQKDYYEKMFHSKIVVTCNPCTWEGDYRTWEGLSTGAMVMVDKMITPIINPLINNKHVVFYDRDDFLKLKKQILFYLKNPDLIKKIAKEGNDYALSFHKASDRIDEILSHL